MSLTSHCTSTQRANLAKLADFLESGIPEGMELKMEAYLTTPKEGEWYLPGEARYECGTCACAVGFGPLAGIPANTHEGWSVYEARAFGADYTDAGITLWNNIFSPSLSNSPTEAAARIRAALEG